VKTILLVDDSEDDVFFALSAFKQAKLTNPIQVCVNGLDALEYLRREGNYAEVPPEHPAVILLDVRMPKMDGLELLKIIREDQDLKLIPVVMLTSSRSDRDILTSYEHHANAFVIKPVDPQQFLEAVMQIGLFWAVTNTPLAAGP
jgi:CheY-like chemotaxis protein